MGCDIHLYIEKRKKSNKNWELDTCKPFKEYKPLPEDNTPEGYGEVEMGRDYALFGILAGVRNSWISNNFQINGLEKARLISQGYEPSGIGLARGLPTNLSKKVEEFNDSYSDNHSHSWGSLPDIKFWSFIYKQRGGDNCSMLNKVQKRMETLEKQGHQTRAVFWFDS